MVEARSAHVVLIRWQLPAEDRASMPGTEEIAAAETHIVCRCAHDLGRDVVLSFGTRAL